MQTMQGASMISRHFAPNPCENKSGDWGASTSNPDEATCGACAPIAAKHKRGAALQEYEQAEVAYREATMLHIKAAEACGAAAHAASVAASKMNDARKVVIDLLGGAE